MLLKKTGILLVFILCFFHGNAQIINIEEKRLKGENGWKGSADLDFAFTKNQNELLELENNIQFAFKSNRNLYLFLNETELIKEADSDVLNNGFQHIRYNYSLTDFVIFEAFAQHQFNQIQEIDRRILLGLGPRFNIIHKDSIGINVGIQIMREWEKTDVYQQNFRSSNYFSFYWELSNSINFISTTYYQPLLSDFDDYRISNETALLFDLPGNFGIKLVYEVLKDSQVPLEVPELTYSFKTGIAYSI